MLENEYIKQFENHNVPESLLLLLEFSNEKAGSDYFSDGFEFLIESEKHGLKTYSEDELFLNSIVEFAVADGTGSTYGFWLKENDQTLSSAPIVTFGSEGGFHVVANNFDELLQILTFDAEPMIDWDEVCYYKDPDDYEPSTKNSLYCKWLKDSFSLDPVENADAIVKSAQKNHQVDFKNWVAKYYQD